MERSFPRKRKTKQCFAERKRGKAWNRGRKKPNPPDDVPSDESEVISDSTPLNFLLLGVLDVLRLWRTDIRTWLAPKELRPLKLTNYYSFAMKNNSSSLEEMQGAVMATFYHVSSTDDNPYHDLYPQGPDSWRKQQRDKARGEEPPPHRYKLPHHDGVSTAIVRFNEGNESAIEELSQGLSLRLGTQTLQRAKEKDARKLRKAKYLSENTKRKRGPKEKERYCAGAF
ncbi:hypothetical protein HPB47_002384 [Ixodes persulcatus]|uniref:Uncharacterized protein n=1 Tax=Ixodes persulcatus TaxID=34615 RepID=A0AC60PML0_IXOPE|nr:hypothetical protein HPB47_002384 [Ixodes persulcatus]